MGRDCLLGDVVTLQRGYDLPSHARREGPIPIISSSGVTGTHAEAKVAGPGVVTGRYGTLGEIHYVPGAFWPLNTTLYVRDFKGNDPRFVAYFLQTLNFANRSAAAAVPGINRNDLHRIPVHCPDLQQQHRIASILSAYDDLIENNTRRIAILEEMARRIYEEWFVRFRFPGREGVRMVESELGLVPEGWQLQTLGDLFDFVGGAQPPKSEHVYEAQPGYVRFVQNRDYGSSDHLTYIRASQRNKLCDRLDIMVDKYGDAGRVRFGIAGAYNVALAKIEPHSPSCREWLRGFLSRDDFRQYLANASQAATRPSLNPAHFRVPVPRPPDDLCQRFEEQIVPIVLLILNRRDAISNLKTTRELLLPKLISGELDVSGTPDSEALAA